jgi:HD superfamily phosphohydrolase YqeK
LKIENRDLYNAIAEHTLGNVPMSGLSKVLFLADCLEESRPKAYTTPIWKALDMKGSCDLDRAIVVAIEEGFKHLMEDGKPIHPLSVEVRNFYLRAVR